MLLVKSMNFVGTQYDVIEYPQFTVTSQQTQMA